MKRIILVLVLFLTSLFSKSTTESPLALSKGVFIDLDINECNQECLIEYLEEGYVFSFMAKYKAKNVTEKSLIEAYDKLKTLFNIESEIIIDIADTSQRKIAILIPQVTIGKYAMTTTNSVISYLISKKQDFELEVFLSGDQSEENIVKSLNEIREKGYSFVIAPVTNQGARAIMENSSGLVIYIPTLNQDFLGSYQYNVFYGGVDYIKQIQELLPYAKNGLTILKSKGDISNTLTDNVKANYDNVVYEKEITQTSDVKATIAGAKNHINGASLFLNTPLLKTAVVLSQLRMYNISPYSILSTQINYDPNIFALSQLSDRKNFLIANSITDTNFELAEINKMLYSDIKYNWINYSTTVGIDFIYNKYFKEPKLFTETMQENQVVYNISIMRPLDGNFKVIPAMK